MSQNKWTTEERRLWGIVCKDTWDYNSWLAFLATVEKNNPPDPEKIRFAYRAFLTNYPLDLDRIKAFAFHEKIFDMDSALNLYANGHEDLKYSVEYWIQFYDVALSAGKDYAYIHDLLVKATSYVGSYYTSKPLWELAIQYEEKHNEWQKVSSLYEVIFEQSAVEDIDVFFSRFKELVNNKLLNSLFTKSDDWDGIPARLMRLSEKERISEYIRVKEEPYLKGKMFQEKIMGYETLISRSAFHHGHIEDNEAGAWHEYLDFMESQYPHKAKTLYKRCLIRCATRADIWMRYIDSLYETQQSHDEIIHSLNNALLFSEKKDQLSIRIFKAKYLEYCGNCFDALQEYHSIRLLYPYSNEVLQMHANLEHRMGDNLRACAVFEEAINAEKQTGEGLALPALLLEYSRFASVVLENPRKSKDILSEILYLKLTKPVIEGVIDLASSYPDKERSDFVDFVDSLVQNFVVSDLSDTISTNSDKQDVSLLYLEFLDCFGQQELIDASVKRHLNMFHKSRSHLSKQSCDSAKDARAYKKAKKDATDSEQAEPVTDVIVLTLEEFMSKYEVIQDVIINVGFLKGRMITKLTDIGRRLLRAVYNLLRKRHGRMLSWNGLFNGRDIMVTFDPSSCTIICSFKKQPAMVDDANWMAWTNNDNMTMKGILHPFFFSGITYRYPLYLYRLFGFLENRPLNLGSNPESRALHLEQLGMHPVFRVPLCHINLCRGLHGYLKEVLQWNYSSFDSKFSSCPKVDISAICGTDDLVNEVYKYGKQNAHVHTVQVYGVGRTVSLIRHFDSHALDHLKKLMLTIISLEELIHVADYHFSEVICYVVEDLCIVKDEHVRLQDIYATYSASD